MKHVRLGSMALGISLALTGLAPLARAGKPSDVPPIAPPYDAQRALAESSFVRLEWHDAQRNRDVPVKIYFPKQDAAQNAQPMPVIIFSHGLGGTREGYEYLARQWAANGYVCVHLQHAGSDDSAWRGKRSPMQSMRQAASYQNAADRARDVTFAIDQLQSLNRDDPRLKGRLDLERIGVAGHSFGAQTTLLAAGQRIGINPGGAGLKDPRVKAAVAMSAPVPAARDRLDEIYSDIAIPVFVMTGTKDDSPLNETKAADRRLPFDHIQSKPAYLLTLSGGDHMVFSGRLVERPGDAEMQKLIRLSSTAFWDAYLRDNKAAATWLSTGGFEALLGEEGTLERK
jgi:predicted dienelactone hydrolase